MIKELNHVAIRCADMNMSINFYRDILAGKVIRYNEDDDGNPRFVYIQLADGIIELIKGEKAASNLGLQHVAFLISNSTNLDAVYEKLLAMGYEFTTPPKTAASGDGRLMFFKDKSGTIFEMIERNENIRVEGLKNERIAEFDHISIRVSDECAEVCAKFYTDILGFTVRRVLERPGSVMSYYKYGPDTLETLYSRGKPVDSKPLGHIAFRVADCYKTKKYLESQGVVCREPKESALGGFNIMNIQGPDGETLEFLDRPALEEYVPTVK